MKRTKRWCVTSTSARKFQPWEAKVLAKNFKDVDHSEVVVMKLDRLNQTAIEALIANLGVTSYITELDENGFKASTDVQSFHQAQIPISDRGLIADFLML